MSTRPGRPLTQLDASWDETFERLRVLRRRTGRATTTLAADITQDVIVRSIASGALERVDNPTAWLYRSARNAVIDHYRTRHVHDPLDPIAELLARARTRRRPSPTRPPATSPAACNRSSPSSPTSTATRSTASTSTGQTHQHAAAEVGISDIRDEVPGPARPPPAQGSAHRLLRRRTRPARRRRRLPPNAGDLRLQQLTETAPSRSRTVPDVPIEAQRRLARAATVSVIAAGHGAGPVPASLDAARRARLSTVRPSLSPRFARGPGRFHPVAQRALNVDRSNHQKLIGYTTVAIPTTTPQRTGVLRSAPE